MIGRDHRRAVARFVPRDSRPRRHSLVVAIGFGVGTFGTLIGAGRGFILTPILLLLYPHDSARQRCVDDRNGPVVALATVPGAIGGAPVGTIRGGTDARRGAVDDRRGVTLAASPARIADLRRTEFARLDARGQVYLDYTGAAVYAQSQLDEHMALLRDNVFGNPHSANPTSAAMTELVEQARAAVLAFFGASASEYEAIFTPNATGALRLVGEAYPFRPGDRFLLTFDNHNSVNGIREFARARRADTTYVPSAPPDLRVDASLLPRYLTDAGGDHHNLFAYPAQSNFSGVRHPLEWIDEAHERGWDVLLDAAAFVPTNRLDLSRHSADFVALSFYKMFGWPTGVGALIARRDALAKLERPWFSGGTIVAAFVQREWYQSAPGAAHFEDGTVNFLNLPAVEIGLRLLDRVGIDAIHDHVQVLGARLLDGLTTLRHRDGSPAAVVYGPTTMERRGATFAFNFLHPDGRPVDERYVDRVAREHSISLRTGCFCNPGAGEVAFTISRETLVGGEFGHGMTLDDYVRAIGLPTGGAIRASLGLASNTADIERFTAFASEFVDLDDVPADLPPRTGC